LFNFVLSRFIEQYHYAEKEPMQDEILDFLESDKHTLLQYRSFGDRILKRIVDFVEIFINGVAGE